LKFVYESLVNKENFRIGLLIAFIEENNCHYLKFRENISKFLENYKNDRILR